MGRRLRRVRPSLAVSSGQFQGKRKVSSSRRDIWQSLRMLVFEAIEMPYEASMDGCREGDVGRNSWGNMTLFPIAVRGVGGLGTKVAQEWSFDRMILHRTE